MIRPLDIVRTPKGAIALVVEVSRLPVGVSIVYFPNQEKTYEHNAWWRPELLHVLGSLPAMIGNALAHPFGCNGEQGDRFFKETI